MAEHSELHAFVGHENPSIVVTPPVRREPPGGDVCDAQAVAAFARAKEIDIAMVSADEPLAAGVVDALLAQGTRAVGPTAAGAEIEWNKTFARSVLAEVAPEACRCCASFTTRASSRRARVLRLHARRRQAAGADRRQGRQGHGPAPGRPRAARDYALELLARGGGGGVQIEEKIVGAEFTIQAISDGRTVVFPPSTYDYPYRFDGDHGPGTGGMGSLSMVGARSRS